jgi:hypothetical protein
MGVSLNGKGLFKFEAAAVKPKPPPPRPPRPPAPPPSPAAAPRL